ncbi:SMP-30/gluconolactonase/LRE family protein [Mesorhizobium sp. PUT5]|uniref:SMP-30/gluconolactonase/LRE family protein n=1 Tax=Mesorhizobium sp. PUT5 TaxID=3454629 RepID=UPI003FA49FB3
MTGTIVTHLAASRCRLGEGPLWIAEREELVFVDILKREVLTWHATRGLARRAMDRRVTCIVLDRDGGFVVAAERGLCRMVPETGALVGMGLDTISPEGTLTNDGKCDRQGRLVFGSKDLAEADRIGRKLSYDGKKVTDFGPIGIFNGPAFSPAGDRIYFADTPTQVIETATYDPETGAVGKPEPFVRLKKGEGYPDGMTVDAEGCLWNARWDGWAIARYAADGTLLQEIAMPVSRPTSLAFGGERLETLFVTSAQQGTEDGPIAAEPQAGDLFACRPGARGLSETPFGGTSHA